MALRNNIASNESAISSIIQHIDNTIWSQVALNHLDNIKKFKANFDVKQIAISCIDINLKQALRKNENLEKGMGDFVPKIKEDYLTFDIPILEIYNNCFIPVSQKQERLTKMQKIQTQLDENKIKSDKKRIFEDFRSKKQELIKINQQDGFIDQRADLLQNEQRSLLIAKSKNSIDQIQRLELLKTSSLSQSLKMKQKFSQMKEFSYDFNGQLINRNNSKAKGKNKLLQLESRVSQKNKVKKFIYRTQNCQIENNSYKYRQNQLKTNEHEQKDVVYENPSINNLVCKSQNEVNSSISTKVNNQENRSKKVRIQNLSMTDFKNYMKTNSFIKYTDQNNQKSQQQLLNHSIEIKNKKIVTQMPQKVQRRRLSTQNTSFQLRRTNKTSINSFSTIMRKSMNENKIKIINENERQSLISDI